MKNLNEKFGAKLDKTNLLVGAGRGKMCLKRGGKSVPNRFPYYVLQGDNNVCKIVTFCDKIGSTMRGVSHNVRGTMSDKTKGKSEENALKVQELCGSDKNSAQSGKMKNETAKNGNASGQKSGTGIVECLSGGVRAGRVESFGGGVGAGRSEEFSSSVGAGRSEDFSSGVRAGREKCVNLSDSEMEDVRKIAKRRVVEMQKMEEGVHPVFMRGATKVLSDRDKLRLQNEFYRFGLKTQPTNAETIDCVSEGAFCKDESGAKTQINKVEENIGTTSEFSLAGSGESASYINKVGRTNDDFEQEKINGGVTNKADKFGVTDKAGVTDEFCVTDKPQVSYGAFERNYGESDGFSYDNSSIKDLDGYEQVSRCILCSPNVAYGEDAENEYAKNDFVNYGRLVFDDSGSADENSDGGETSGSLTNGKKDTKVENLGSENAGSWKESSKSLGSENFNPANDGLENLSLGNAGYKSVDFESADYRGVATENADDKSLGSKKLNSESLGSENAGLQEKSKRKKGKAKAYIVGAGDVNDCFPAGKFDNPNRKMIFDVSVIGLDEEFIPMEVKNCELLNMRLDKRDVKFWGEKEWAKFFIKVDPCLNMCIDYCDRLVEKMVIFGGFSAESVAYGSAENMFNDMIDLIERKKMYLRLRKFVDRLKKELDAVDEKIIAYFVFGENTKDELLKIISRRTVYRRASKVIKKLADFCVARGYTASWLYDKFGTVV